MWQLAQYGTARDRTEDRSIADMGCVERMDDAAFRYHRIW